MHFYEVSTSIRMLWQHNVCIFTRYPQVSACISSIMYAFLWRIHKYPHVWVAWCMHFHEVSTSIRMHGQHNVCIFTRYPQVSACMGSIMCAFLRGIHKYPHALAAKGVHFYEVSASIRMHGQHNACIFTRYPQVSACMGSITYAFWRGIHKYPHALAA